MTPTASASSRSTRATSFRPKSKDLKAAERDELVKKHGYKAMDYHE